MRLAVCMLSNYQIGKSQETVTTIYISGAPQFHRCILTKMSNVFTLQVSESARTCQIDLKMSLLAGSWVNKSMDHLHEHSRLTVHILVKLKTFSWNKRQSRLYGHKICTLWGRLIL
jgi:hypothetical protein